MKTIHKYVIPFEINTEHPVEMPVGARIVHMDAQGGSSNLHLWAMIETTSRTEWRKFMILKTGGEIPANAYAHVGTTLVHDGRFVWHVFEIRP